MGWVFALWLRVRRVGAFVLDSAASGLAALVLFSLSIVAYVVIMDPVQMLKIPESTIILHFSSLLDMLCTKMSSKCSPNVEWFGIGRK